MEQDKEQNGFPKRRIEEDTKNATWLVALSKRSKLALIFGSSALSMKTVPLRAGTTANSLENEDDCPGWRCLIIESAGEPDFLLGPKPPRATTASLSSGGVA